ncbi:MAG: hypothetical protein HGA78_08120, partial [Nitrospirales bacterium]|nr:hypothetical protein [Nitrospirales bacterium]
MKSRISVVFLIFCLMIGSFVYSIALAEQPYSQGGSAQQDGINTGSPTNPSALDEARLFLPAQGKVPVFPINRESGQQLSEAAKDEVKAIVAREFDGYKNHITDIKTMSFSFMGGTSLIIAVFAAIHGLQSYYARKDSKELMDTLEKKMANITNKYLSIAQETISATIASTEARLRLTREITDLDDPSIRRSDEEISTAEIKNFLWAVATQKDMVEKTFKTLPESGKDSEGMPHLQDSIFDHRIIGKAHAYIKDYDKAIECFQKEIELLEKEKGKSKDNSLIERLGKELDEARLRLGNSYAGNSDYRQAIKQYDKMGDEKNLNIRKHLSKAHAYKNLVDFNKAVKACRSAIDSYKHCYPDPAGTSFSDAKGDRKRYIAARCYWESKYELANSLVALGEYESAAEEYKNLCDKIARQEIRDAVDPVWLYLSYGECLWKGKRDYKDIEDILKQYEESDRNAPSEEKGKILYKRGRLLISSGKLHEAEKSFYEIEDYGYNVG